jgi:uracil DNA glycosylase
VLSTMYVSHLQAMADVGIRKPTHGSLENWSRQGVLLLNAVLTVGRPPHTASHTYHFAYELWVSMEPLPTHARVSDHNQPP